MRVPSWFWAGLAARLLTAPFLLKWYHPDERQLLEFAHYFAHGRLHPLLESDLGLRNQSFPWLFSWIVRLLDVLGFDNPQAWLIAFHSVIGTLSLLGLLALVRSFDLTFLDRKRASNALGWVFALFWGFPWLYSRGLLEAISFPFAAFAFLALRQNRAGFTGFFSGIAGVLRYPSALLGVGALLAWIARRNPSTPKKIALGLTGLGLAIFLGGIADWISYGSFLHSARAYWEFNRPGGPVAELFGRNSLYDYWHWFAYLLTPWVAAPFIGAAIAALAIRSDLFWFCLPYVVGHLWSEHREPRFLLPVFPFLVLALWEAWAAGWGVRARAFWNSAPAAIRLVFKGVLIVHLVINFAWYPLQAWSQRSSAQAQLILNHEELAAEPGRLLALAAPVVDAIVPQNLAWSGPRCRWRRPAEDIPENSPVWVLAIDREDGSCAPIHGQPVQGPRSRRLRRVLDAQPATLWRCRPEAIRSICPEGIEPAPPGFPFTGESLRDALGKGRSDFPALD